MTGDQIEIRFLGPPQLLRGGRPLAGWRSRKALALLAYLALHDRPVVRATLAEMLWPDSDEARGRANLSWALNHVNSLLAGCLAADRHALHFRRDDAHISLDTIQFSRLKVRNTVEALEEAVALVQGDLLDGFALDGCPDFELWLVRERERWQRLAADAWSALIAHHRFNGNYDAAVTHARRLLAYIPWQESAHRHLMLLLALSGRRSAALAQYETCRRLLAEELGVAPSDETNALLTAIREDDQPRLASWSSGVETSPAGLAAPRPTARPVAPAHNLPRQFTSFIGRERELAAIAARLAEPETSLITLTGPGGVGKTRLALAAAAAQLGRFADGVIFVPLAAVSTVDQIAPAIAEALRFPFDGRPGAFSAEEQLLGWLANRQVLLVLDNFEHLTDGRDLLLRLLARSPLVKLLVTSRHHLNVQAETLLDLAGLPFPSSGNEAGADEYPAVRLLVDRAIRQRYDYELPPSDVPLAVSLCHMLAGYPLALELSAALLANESLSELAAQVATSLDALRSDMHDLPPRHLSLKAVFLHSWRLLTGEEQRVLASLVVFREGFTLPAFCAVSRADEPTLRALVQKSLVQAVAADRFDLHPLIAQYLRELLDAGEHAAARTRHCHHILAFAEAESPRLLGEGQADALAQLHCEQANLLAAWQTAINQRDTVRIRSAMNALFRYWTRQSDFRAGVEFFDIAAKALAATEPALAASLRLRALGCIHWEGYGQDHAEQALRDLATVHEAGDRHSLAMASLLAGRCVTYQAHSAGDIERELLLAGQALFAEFQDDEGLTEIAILFGFLEQQQANHSESRRWYQLAAEALRRRGDRQRLAFVLFRHARMAFLADAFDEAGALAGESLTLHTELGDQRGVLHSQTTLGLVAFQQGRLDEAAAHFSESLELARYLGNHVRVANNLNNLGVIAETQGRFADAATWFEQAEAEFVQLNNPDGVALVQNNRGVLAEKTGDLGQAVSWLQQSLAQRERAGTPRGVVITRLNLGFALEAGGSFDAALTQFQHAARAGMEKGMEGWTVDALAGISLVWMDAGRLEEGIALAGLALASDLLAVDVRGRLNARLEELRAEFAPEWLATRLVVDRDQKISSAARQILEESPAG